jgi:hypothetical protein
MNVANGSPFFLILFLLGVLLLIYFTSKSRDSFFSGLASALNAKIVQHGWWTASTTLVGNFHGKDYSVRYIPGGRYVPSKIEITLSGDNSSCLTESADFSIRKQGVLDSIGEAVGIEHEITVGEKDFDQKYFISAQNPAPAQLYLRDSNHRAGIDAFFHLYSVQVIYFKQKSISTLITLLSSWDSRSLSWAPRRDLTPNLITNYLTQLNKLIEQPNDIKNSARS